MKRNEKEGEATFASVCSKEKDDSFYLVCCMYGTGIYVPAVWIMGFPVCVAVAGKKGSRDQILWPRPVLQIWRSSTKIWQPAKKTSQPTAFAVFYSRLLWKWNRYIVLYYVSKAWREECLAKKRCRFSYPISKHLVQKSFQESRFSFQRTGLLCTQSPRRSRIKKTAFFLLV